MINLKSKTGQLIFFAVIVFLIGGYFVYDFQRGQALKEEVFGLKMEIVALRNEKAPLGENLSENEMAEISLIRSIGFIEIIEDGDIFLKGRVFPLSVEGEDTTVKFSDPDNKEYRIVLNSETRIYKIADKQEMQEIGLGDFKEGNLISVIGEVNTFNKQEISAQEVIFINDGPDING